MDTSNSAHGAAAASSSSSSRRSISWKYEVFLSFRGEDTRNTFTDHLNNAFRRTGINTFIDYQLRKGEDIQRELDREIEGSKIAVVVFSKRYAESRWCLKELSKIMRCREEQEGKKVYPIFYDVDPSEVRKQKDSFLEAFQKHGRDEDPNEVKQWRKDLKDSADLGGRDLKTTADRREGLFIEKIVEDIMGLLKTTDLKQPSCLVGMELRVKEFSTGYLDVGGLPDVQIIGIWGMGGIGKTTIARAIFNIYQHSFGGQCYLEEVRSKEKNMVSLQEQLLRDILKQSNIKVSSVAEGIKEIEKRLRSMKVLIVVDGIDDADQLDGLAIDHKSFGPGSRIIITTRDQQVLNIKKVDKRYKAQQMTNKEAIELLSWHAFGKPDPDEGYDELASDVVDYCGGLPLALEVVGRLLATERRKSIWESTLNKLRNIQERKIYKTLKLSYNELSDDHVQDVFLDISHFFIGWPKSDVKEILDSCSRISVEAEITTLCKRCLLDIDSLGRLRMHDLIRDMGREIVRLQSTAEPGKRSRLWHSEDVTSVLREECGTKAVQGLASDLSKYSVEDKSFSTEAFMKMRRLKFFQLENVKLNGIYSHLSKDLRLLSWLGFPLESVPADFDLRKLIYMDLSCSKIVRVWEDSDLLPERLKCLILSHSHNLTELPDFSKFPHLHRLDLSDCNITDDAVLEGLGALLSLTILVLDGNGFNRLPILSGLFQLQLLHLNHCTNLLAIPDLPTSLIKLEANYCTALERMPDFSEMSKMVELQLKDCCKLKDIPNLDHSFNAMFDMHMEGCTSLTDTFKENIIRGWITRALDGLFLSGIDIPNWFTCVLNENNVAFEVQQRTDAYIRGLAVCIVYTADLSDITESGGSLCIHVVNYIQRTHFVIRPMVATVTASHECCLWLGHLSNRKLDLKEHDSVRVRAEFDGPEDNQIKVKKTGVYIVECDSFDGVLENDLSYIDLREVHYERVPYESGDDGYQTCPDDDGYQTCPDDDTVDVADIVN